MLRWKLFRSRWLAIGWLLLICVLFFLPGSQLPTENYWMEQIRIDKLFHIGLFAILVFLWYSAFTAPWKYYVLLVLLCAVLYGFAVEIIQLLWIPNRSFDLFDLVADTVGCMVGWLIWSGVYKKNKPL